MSDTPLADAVKHNTIRVKVDEKPGEHHESATYTHQSDHWSASVAAGWDQKKGQPAQWSVTAEGKIEWEP